MAGPGVGVHARDSSGRGSARPPWGEPRCLLQQGARSRGPAWAPTPHPTACRTLCGRGHAPFVSLQSSRRQMGTKGPWRQVFKGVRRSGRLLRRAAEVSAGQGGHRGPHSPIFGASPDGSAAVRSSCPWLQGRELHPLPGTDWRPRVALPGLGPCTSPSSCALGLAAGRPWGPHRAPPREEPPQWPTQHPRHFSLGSGHLWSASGRELCSDLPPGGCQNSGRGQLGCALQGPAAGPWRGRWPSRWAKGSFRRP